MAGPYHRPTASHCAVARSAIEHLAVMPAGYSLRRSSMAVRSAATQGGTEPSAPVARARVAAADNAVEYASETAYLA